MSQVSLSLMFLFALQISQIQSQHIPNGFKCEKDSPIKKSVDSKGKIKVDLTTLFCGKMEAGSNIPVGFYALLNNQIPKSVDLHGVLLQKPPCDENDYAIYSGPNIFNGYFHSSKISESNVWPTAIPPEQLVEAIVHMADLCG